MSVSHAASTNETSSHDPEEVVRLFCPDCSGKLNLRRKHLGIKGSCVHCSSPVMAVDEGGVVSLVNTAKEKTEPEVEKKAMGEVVATNPEPAPSPAVPNSEAAESTTTQREHAAAPRVDAPRVDAPASPPAEIPTQEAVVSPPETAPDLSQSTWGFPERESEVPAAAPATPPPAEATPPSFEAAPQPQSNEKPANPAFDFSQFETSLPEPAAAIESPIPDLPSMSPAPADEIAAPTDSASSFVDEPILPELTPESKTNENPATDKPAETPDPGDDPFEYDALPKQSALFNSVETEVGVNSGWGTKVPSQNHASISPFSTGSAALDGASDPEPGFAEALFQEKGNSSAPSSVEPKSPFASSGDSAASSPAAPEGAASPFASIGQEPSGEEPVVLDGDGRPMAPMTDEEKDAFAREMMELGDYHKRSPWVKRIRRFIITLVVLIGGTYAAYVFMPRDLAKEYKNKALSYLEPGSVLLDFLPFEIADDPEGEEGDKRVKIKAIDGLNQLTDQMDGYLNAADENLRESGATVEEREKIEHMEGPNIPKLPFNLPDMQKLQEKVDQSAADAAEGLDQ